jgi:hypothetical protein
VVVPRLTHDARRVHGATPGRSRLPWLT